MRILFFCLFVSSIALADNPDTFQKDGKEIDFGSKQGCASPETKNGIVMVNCSMSDGAVSFYDELTGETISICPFWGCDMLKDDVMKQTCKTECPPKQWPIEIPNCDKPVAESIVGTWRQDSFMMYTGLTPIAHEGWSMTFTDRSMHFDFQGIVQFERSISVADTNNRHLTLELKDESGETETINIKRMPCGLMLEPKAECSAFCRNLHSEFSEEDRHALVRKVAVGFKDSTIEKIIENSSKEPLKPFFSSHTFFREVLSNR